MWRFFVVAVLCGTEWQFFVDLRHFFNVAFLRGGSSSWHQVAVLWSGSGDGTFLSAHSDDWDGASVST